MSGSVSAGAVTGDSAIAVIIAGSQPKEKLIVWLSGDTDKLKKAARPTAGPSSTDGSEKTALIKKIRSEEHTSELQSH